MFPIISIKVPQPFRGISFRSVKYRITNFFTTMASSEKTETDVTETQVNSLKRKCQHLHASGKKKKKRKALLQVEDPYSKSDYYFQNGLRKVYPYHFSFTAYAKRRWVGREILEVCDKEFRGDLEDGHEKSILAGNITANGKVVSSTYIVRENDIIRNHVHRHENPVTDQPIDFLHIDDSVVVINKPASIPCHPCGRYRFNSVMYILAKQYGLEGLRPVHRLDRLTSGVLVIGRSAEKTRELMRQVSEKLVEKEYLTRVTGEFPEGVVEVDRALSCISRQLCLYRVDPAGKPCHTTFKRVHFNGRSSVVHCQPHTGRTHQIRVHLQYLGHPITNDPLYNTDAWGANRCKGGVLDKSLDELQEAIRREHYVGHYIDNDDDVDDKNRNDSFNSKSGNVTRLASPDCRGHTKLSSDHDKTFSDESKIRVTDGPRTVDTEGIGEGLLPCSSSAFDKRGVSPRIEERVTNEDVRSAVADSASNSRNHGDRDAFDVDSEVSESLSRLTECVIRESSKYDADCIRGEDSVEMNDTKVGGTSSERERQTNECKSSSGTANLASVSCLDIERSRDMGASIRASLLSRSLYNPGFDPSRLIPDPDCYQCRVRYIDPKPSDLILYLHALKYKGPDWEYSTDVPTWAKPDWTDD